MSLCEQGKMSWAVSGAFCPEYVFVCVQGKMCLGSLSGFFFSCFPSCVYVCRAKRV